MTSYKAMKIDKELYDSDSSSLNATEEMMKSEDEESNKDEVLNLKLIFRTWRD